MRRLGVLFAALLAGCAVLLASPPRFLQRRAIGWASRFVERRSSLRLEIEKIGGSPFAAVSADGVVLREAAGGRVLFKADSVEVGLSWAALLRRRLAIDSIVLDGPVLDGSSLTSSAPAAGKSGLLDPAFEALSVSIRRGRLLYGGAVFTQIEAQGRLSRDKVLIERLSAAFGDGRLEGRGEIPLSGRARATARLRSREVPLERLAALFVPLPARLQLRHSGVVEWTSEGSDWSLKTSGRLNDGGLDGEISRSGATTAADLRFENLPVRKTWTRSKAGLPPVSGRLQAELTRGRGTARLRLAANAFTLSAEAKLDAPARASAGHFHLSVSDMGSLASWGPPLESLHGVLSASGTWHGAWNDPGVEARMLLAGVSDGKRSAREINLVFERRSRRPGALRLRAEAADLRWSGQGPGGWNIAAARLDLEGTAENLSGRVKARFENGSELRYSGPLKRLDEGWRVGWNELTLTPVGAEPLAADAGGHADIAGAARFNLQGLRLRSGGGILDVPRASVGARTLHFEARAAALDLAPLARVLRPGAGVEGVLEGRVQLDGDLERPAGFCRLALSSAAAAGVRLPQVLLKARMVDAWIVIDAFEARTTLLDVPVRAKGRVPWRLINPAAPDLPFDVALSAPVIDARLLTALWAGLEADPGGQLHFEGALNGRLPRPRLTGQLTGALPGLRIPAAGLELRDLAVDVREEQERLEIRRFDAKIGKGSLQIRGDSRLPRLSARLSARNIDVRKPREWDATGDVDLSLGGAVDAPELSGTVRLEKGTYTAPAKKSESAAAPTGPLWTPLALNVAAQWSGDVWYRDGLTKIETRADVRVRKNKGEDGLYLSGPLDLLRGTYEVMNNDFVVKSGRLFFTGPPDINPQLNIAAQRSARDYAVDITITGTRRAPALHASCTPSLPEQECLSVVAYGRPVGAATQGGADATNLAADLLSGYITKELRSSGMNYLSLDVVRVQATEKGRSWTVGRYLGSKLFVSYSQNPNDSAASVVNAEYSLSPVFSVVGQTGSGGDSYMDLQFRLPIKRRLPTIPNPDLRSALKER